MERTSLMFAAREMFNLRRSAAILVTQPMCDRFVDLQNSLYLSPTGRSEDLTILN